MNPILIDYTEDSFSKLPTEINLKIGEYINYIPSVNRVTRENNKLKRYPVLDNRDVLPRNAFCSSLAFRYLFQPGSPDFHPRTPTEVMGRAAGELSSILHERNIPRITILLPRVPGQLDGVTLPIPFDIENMERWEFILSCRAIIYLLYNYDRLIDGFSHRNEVVYNDVLRYRFPVAWEKWGDIMQNLREHDISP